MCTARLLSVQGVCVSKEGLPEGRCPGVDVSAGGNKLNFQSNWVSLHLSPDTW